MIIDAIAIFLFCLWLCAFAATPLVYIIDLWAKDKILTRSALILAFIVFYTAMTISVVGGSWAKKGFGGSCFSIDTGVK